MHGMDHNKKLSAHYTTARSRQEKNGQRDKQTKIRNLDLHNNTIRALLCVNIAFSLWLGAVPAVITAQIIWCTG